MFIYIFTQSGILTDVSIVVIAQSGMIYSEWLIHFSGLEDTIWNLIKLKFLTKIKQTLFKELVFTNHHNASHTRSTNSPAP